MNHKDLCYLSNAVYLDTFDSYKSLGFDKSIKVASSHDFCAVLLNSITKDLVIVFRGSDDVEDWIDNFEFLSTETERFGRVHSGFLKAYSEFSDKILLAIKGIYRSDAKFTITGHSLGGALGTLLSIDLRKIYPDSSISLVTFGSPKVGKSAFKKIFEDSKVDYTRYVNGNDIVPMLPRSYTLYTHVGTLSSIGSSSIWSKLLGSIEDHLIKNYCRDFKV